MMNAGARVATVSGLMENGRHVVKHQLQISFSPCLMHVDSTVKKRRAFLGG